MQFLARFYTVVFIALVLVGCDSEVPVSSELVEQDEESAIVAEDQNGLSKHNRRIIKQRAEVAVFQPAGDFGGGVLEPGTFFPPINGGISKLVRGNDWIRYELQTDGLPPGAYTNWWVIINNPEECSGECGLDDIFGSPATNPSVFWATGGIVEEDGVGYFQAKIREGEPSGGPDGFILGNGLEDAANAEVHIIIKYHGPASDDPDVLYEQTHTLLGSCDVGANSSPNGQCFDPQFAIHRRDFADIAVDKTELNFRHVQVGSQRERTFRLRNEGGEPLEVTRARLAGSNGDEFELLNLNLPFAIEPNEDLEITVRFSPESIGNKHGRVLFSSNDPDEDPFLVKFRGKARDED